MNKRQLMKQDRKIIQARYGMLKQMMKVREELLELVDEVDKEIETGCVSKFRKSLFDERCDVEVCLNHLDDIYKFRRSDILERMLYKTKRQLKRIKEEKHDNSNRSR